MLLGALTGCFASFPWWEGPVADASTPHVIYFERDAYKVDESYRPMLEAHARKMKNAPGLRMLIQAHADRVGSSGYNRALSHKRAEMVMRELVALGVPADRLEIDGRGEPRHAGKGQGAEAPASERRVELIYR
ncbi:OmpA family protein [Piscinibacter sp.]|uniref:OmpA family protein n=1 Tax=Piscinibacter sp. TaxID=1903157 RepID=UPI002ED5EF2A